MANNSQPTHNAARSFVHGFAIVAQAPLRIVGG